MDENIGSQYAIQIAVHTLTNRCRVLQERVASLELENTSLRMNVSHKDSIENSLTEIDKLKQNITELNEQNHLLEVKHKMVSNENNALWKELSKLSKTNTQMNQIKENVSHTTNNQPPALIRSKTFTQRRALEENGKISLELEDISLKLADSINRQKLELDELVAEINDSLIISEKYAFHYADDQDEELLAEIETIAKQFTGLAQEVALQRDTLTMQVQLVEKFVEINNKNSKPETLDKSTSTAIETEDEAVEATESNSPNEEPDKICPMCNQRFLKNFSFNGFQRHVEEHFET